MEFNEIIDSYVNKTNAYYIQKERLENKILKAQAKLSKLNQSSPSWVKNTLVPLAKEIKKRLRARGLDIKAYDIYGPFGCECETSIYFSSHGKDGHIEITKVSTLSLTVRPQWKHNDTYTRTTGFELTYLVNVIEGFKPLPYDIDEIIKLLRQSEH